MSVRPSLIPIVLLVGATVVALSCRDASPVGLDGRASALPGAALTPHAGGDDADDPDDPDDDGDGPDSLVSCRRLRYDSVTQTIGPEGGEVEVGRNWLVVPRGALREPVSITAVAPSDTVAMVRFQPEGLRFQNAALLVVTYDNCRVPKAVTPRLAQVTDSLDVIEFLTPGRTSPSDLRRMKGHKGHRHVTGQLQHFSNYAVAW
ncbi:MAG TPA: hypothetical protein VGQ25_06155 [Gemmatimonadales bacterium]|jgi:hypothetical protein|nr:hypothetical protein [Gemmatimonadales bacterium]